MSEKNPTAAELGAKGGSARAAKLAPEELSKIAQRAALARWDGKVAKATHEGTLTIGTLEIPCAIINKNGETIRLLSETGIVNALGLYRSGAVHTRERDISESGAQLPLFVANKNVK